VAAAAGAAAGGAAAGAAASCACAIWAPATSKPLAATARAKAHRFTVRIVLHPFLTFRLVVSRTPLPLPLVELAKNGRGPKWKPEGLSPRGFHI
jgi:hypothetical protein